MSKSLTELVFKGTRSGAQDDRAIDVQQITADMLAAGAEVIVGKSEQLKLALACLFADGHLLIEDQPGVGKTTLAHLLATLVGLEFQRVQFTSDMLPADVIGVSIYEKTTGKFHFHRGPIFTHVLLADEVNRATPRAQSALLEAMEERQVSAEGESMDLPRPFFVIATQNPSNQIGTFALPESQLDRFLMRISIGYPSPEAERELLAGEDRRVILSRLDALLSPDALIDIQRIVRSQHASPALLDYVQKLLEHSRHNPQFGGGLSPRAGLGLVHAAKAWSLMAGREHVIPEDVQAIVEPVIGHRLQSKVEHSAEHATVEQLVAAVPIP